MLMWLEYNRVILFGYFIIRRLLVFFFFCVFFSFILNKQSFWIVIVLQPLLLVFNSLFGISFNSIYNFYVFTAYLYSIKSTFDSNFFFFLPELFSFLSSFLSLPFFALILRQYTKHKQFWFYLTLSLTRKLLKVFFIIHVFGMCLVPHFHTMLYYVIQNKNDTMNSKVNFMDNKDADETKSRNLIDLFWLLSFFRFVFFFVFCSINSNAELMPIKFLAWNNGRFTTKV